MSRGTLTVEVQGDSLVAVLEPEPYAVGPREPPLRLATKVDGEVAVFGTRSKEIESINGNDREVTAVAIWTLRAKGDSLVGTLRHMSEGSDGQDDGAQPVIGVRRRK
jgi:hypothetical protein